jgi:hypothetical protein
MGLVNRHTLSTFGKQVIVRQQKMVMHKVRLLVATSSGHVFVYRRFTNYGLRASSC